MKTHHGQIVEYTIRKKGHSIADVARLVNVNRRSVYNWFNQKDLKVEVIYRVGIAIKHDFSKEFPEHFQKDDFEGVNAPKAIGNPAPDDANGDVDHLWKERYITLLESYNNYLLAMTKSVRL